MVYMNPAVSKKSIFKISLSQKQGRPSRFLSEGPLFRHGHSTSCQYFLQVGKMVLNHKETNSVLKIFRKLQALSITSYLTKKVNADSCSYSDKKFQQIFKTGD